jgi:hypothetical protein
MSGPVVVGAFAEAPSELLTAVELEVLPIDLVTEWRRCGMVADFLADYVVEAFERRDAARSILSTVANELIENAAKFSSDQRSPARIAIRHHGEVVHAEVCNRAGEKHVHSLREVLAELGGGDATAVFHRRVERRLGLGLALLAKDYGAHVGATIGPGGGGELAVCLRVALSAAEVEQR